MPKYRSVPSEQFRKSYFHRPSASLSKVLKSKNFRKYSFPIASWMQHVNIRNNGTKMYRDPGDVNGWTNPGWHSNISPCSTNASLKRRRYYGKHRDSGPAAWHDKAAHNHEFTCQKSNYGSDNYVFLWI